MALKFDEVLVDNRTVYQLNNKGTNSWSASVQSPGRKSEGELDYPNGCRLKALRIAALLSVAPKIWNLLKDMEGDLTAHWRFAHRGEPKSKGCRKCRLYRTIQEFKTKLSVLRELP